MIGVGASDEPVMRLRFYEGCVTELDRQKRELEDENRKLYKQLAHSNEAYLTMEVQRLQCVVDGLKAGRLSYTFPAVHEVPDGLQYAAKLAKAQGTEGGEEHDQLLRDAARRLKELAEIGRDMQAEVEGLRESQRAFAETLDFGNGITEPAATLDQMIEPLQFAMSEAHDHIECPAFCEGCGDRLADTICEHCHGSGADSISESVLAFVECEWCAGVGKVHVGCVERSYSNLAEEVKRLEDDLEIYQDFHRDELIGWVL